MKEKNDVQVLFKNGFLGVFCLKNGFKKGKNSAVKY
jgi:hypothetical protein